MIPPFLDIRKVSRRFGDVSAVEEATLEVARGEFLTFLGPSGSGKSTTLYMIAGFLEPSAGDIRMEGRSILKLPPNHRNIGMVFQRYTLFPHLTVAENIAFPLRVRRWKKAEISKKLEQMMALVRIEELAGRMPAQLSGGQQQRVALARALAYNPPLLLMDEPLSALDKKLRDEIQTEIRRIHRETGVTILYVTHDQEEALRLANRVVLFNRGRIEQAGSGRELYQAPRTRFVADFVGNSNFLRCRVTSRRGSRADILFPDNRSLRDVDCPESLAIGDLADLMVRPDRIQVVAEGELGGSIDAVLSDARFIGEQWHWEAMTGWGQKISIRLPVHGANASERPSGSEISIRWAPEDARLFAA